MDRLFIIDTGATNTILDVSLPLGEPTGADEAVTAGDKIIIKYYSPPVAPVGKLPFHVSDSIGVLDRAARLYRAPAEIDYRSASQNRNDNPVPVKKSSGRPLKPKPARRSTWMFGVSR
jgi:hypothetical protein